MAEDIIKTRIKDASIELLIEQFLNAYILGDSTASGTGKILGKTVIDYTLSKIFDSICETQEEFLAAITSGTIHTILWKGNTTLIDFVATAGTFKLIFCQHYSLLGKNSTLVSPAGKNITIYGDLDCATPDTGGFSWTLNSTATSSIKCKWIRNSGVTGKVGIDAGTVLYERIEAGIFSSVVGGAFLKQEFWDNTNDVHKDVSDNKNIWYLDTVNGLDTNSGLSRSAPKKTGDAVVIACKTAGKTTGRLVVMAGSSGVVFNAATWANTAFPFFDVDIESIKTDIEWNGITTDRTVLDPRLRILNGRHVFNDCSPNGYNILYVQNGTFNSGHWQGQNAFEFEDRVTFNGSAIGINAIIKSKDVEIASMLALHGSITLQSDSFSGSGSIGSFSNEDVFLNLETNTFGLEGIFSFPSQSWNSSIKITAAKMKRYTLTKLLYLGAVAKKTVNYQLVVDTMGSIVPMEIANPAGTVAGKVIELLKYENKVDSEIVRATAAEALKEDKSKKNAASGYCPLDANVKVPFANIPDSILGQLEYQGVWDAAAGTFPTATGSGQYWIASSNGTGATASYSTGDWAVYNGTAFDKVDNSDAVFSVNGRMGNVVLEKSDVGLGNVDNVSDANKPVSTATQTALDLKANQTSISNIDNTSDSNKPVSTAQAAAIAAHADLLTGMHGLPALDHFVYGDTAYGGSIVDNLNTLARTMPFTCFGTAVGAPDTTHSWFGWHSNSNAGVVSASQMAIAFGVDLIVKYRTKTASVWGPWRNGSTIVNDSTATAYTFLASDANTCHIVNTSAATTRTVPSDSTAPDIAIGDSIEVQNLGTGVVTFVEASGVTIRSSLTLVMYGQYSVCMLRKIAANTWVLTGERTVV